MEPPALGVRVDGVRTMDVGLFETVMVTAGEFEAA